MNWGFYKELKEMRAEGQVEADFGFLENVPVGDAYNLYDFLHGWCDHFAAALSDFLGYEIEYVIDNNGGLVHAYCVRELASGETAYVDARGITTDAELFFDEFADFCTYYRGELSDTMGNCDVFRCKNSREMLGDGNRELNQDKDLYQFLKDNRPYYDVNVFERSMRKMIENGVEYRVKGYTNKWALIDTLEHYGLLENSTWGDETCYLVVDLNQETEIKRYKRTDGSFVELPTIIEVLGETFDGLEIGLEDLGIDIEEKPLDERLAEAQKSAGGAEREGIQEKEKEEFGEAELRKQQVRVNRKGGVE